MDVDEVGIIFNLLDGYWPTPKMEQAEQAVWIRELEPHIFDVACDVISMLAESGLTWRPRPGEYVQEYRAWRNRTYVPPEPKPQLTEHAGGPNECGHDARALACPATVRYWVDTIQEQLRNLTGPLANSMAGGVHPVSSEVPNGEA